MTHFLGKALFLGFSVVWFIGFLGSCKKTAEYDPDSRPKADFDYEVMGGKVQFRNKSENFTTCRWVFAGGAKSTEVHPSYGFSSTGEVHVTLEVQNELAIKDQITKTINVESNLASLEVQKPIFIGHTHFRPIIYRRTEATIGTSLYFLELYEDNALTQPHTSFNGYNKPLNLNTINTTLISILKVNTEYFYRVREEYISGVDQKKYTRFSNLESFETRDFPYAVDLSQRYNAPDGLLSLHFSFPTGSAEIPLWSGDYAYDESILDIHSSLPFHESSLDVQFIPGVDMFFRCRGAFENDTTQFTERDFEIKSPFAYAIDMWTGFDMKTERQSETAVKVTLGSLSQKRIIVNLVKPLSGSSFDDAEYLVNTYEPIDGENYVAYYGEDGVLYEVHKNAAHHQFKTTTHGDGKYASAWKSTQYLLPFTHPTTGESVTVEFMRFKI